MGYHERLAGDVASLNALATGLGAISAGWISDLWGRKPSLIAGIALTSLFSLIFSLAEDERWMLGMAFAAGGATSLMAVSYAPFMAENSTHEDRIHLFSTVFAVSLLAGGVGNLIGGWLPALWHPGMPSSSSVASYRFALLIGVGVMFLSCLPLLGIQEVPRQSRPENELPRSREPMPRDVLAKTAMFAATGCFLAFGAGLIVPFFNLLFRDYWKASVDTTGWIFSISKIATFLGIALTPMLTARLGKVRMVVLLQGVSIPLLLGLVGLPWLWLAIPAYWMREALMSMVSPTASAFQMEIIPAAFRARVASLGGYSGFGWNIAWALGSALFGRITPRWGYPAVYSIAAACYLISTTLYYLFFRTYKEEEIG